MTTETKRAANTKAQRAFKARMREAGYVQVQVWVRPDRKPELMGFVNLLNQQ